MKVLIADDHRLFAEMLKAMLEADGFEVLAVAHDGAAAVALAEELEPDLVLMDITMPELDGINATSQIRQRLPRTPVLILSGSTAARDVEAAQAAGAAGYVTKTMLHEQLSDAIVAARAEPTKGVI